MISCGYKDFPGIRQELQYLLARQGQVVDVGEWQSIRRSERDLPQQRTIELENVVFDMYIPLTQEEAVDHIQPNMPFAEAQFQDRVSGEPLNPPPSDKLWPWAHHLDDDKATGRYSHTYPERFWPKHANQYFPDRDRRDTLEVDHERDPHYGIRYQYGDLQDVVSQLSRSPYTRQAFLPVWFPEDTGAVHGERVPCSLGYHFLLRRNRLSCTYFIRSVDLFRHFPDDVYMACRLAQWVCEQLEGCAPGTLTMHMVSLHVFEAERKRLERGADFSERIGRGLG